MSLTLAPEERVLDWRPRFDEKSLKFLISVQSDSFSTKKARTRMWHKGVYLDQGAEGACTGFALANCMASTPRVWPGIDDAFARELYYENRRNDEYPGEDYEGSSVLGAMQTATKRGMISAYWWAKTIEELIAGVSHHGPMQGGSPWLSGMDYPDSAGFITVNGRVRGGHSYEWGGVNINEEYFRIDNSWGRAGYGKDGSAKIRFSEVVKLFNMESEFALPHKKKYVLAA